MVKKKIKRKLAYDTSLIVGNIVTGSMSGLVPAAGAGAMANIQAGTSLASVGSIAMGADIALSAMEGIDGKPKRRRKKRR